MTKTPDFDTAAAHKFFSADCFNRAWEYIDKPLRTPRDEENMLQLSLASLWHWTQREDCTPTNLAIGYWQVSRVFALLRQAENARYYGQRCLEAAESEGVEPFYRGYAYEALARAENVDGNHFEVEANLIQAHQIAATLEDQEEKKQMLGDLATIR